jgi:PAS domain S-box-containing protein
MSLILIGIGVVLSSLILINQHYNILRYEFKNVQSSRENILDNMTDGVIGMDKNDNIIFVNKIVESLFEIKSEDIIGRNYKNVISHQEINNILELMKEIKDKEITIRNKSGKYLTLIISFSFVYNEKQELEFSIMVFQDITQSKILTQQLQRNEKLIAMGELAAGVSHEIRNPLNSISILIQRLKSEFEPKDNPGVYHKFLLSIKVEINRLNNVIEQFLKFSKRPKLNLQKTNLAGLINEIIDLIKEEAETKNIQILKNLKVDPVLDLDKEQIKQAILNIIRNAFEAMDNNGELNILLKSEKENVILEISDTGYGIPKENLSKIFNIYFSTKPNGSGIGLSIVNQIISEHNGKIEVESEAGIGTKFRIFL